MSAAVKIAVGDRTWPDGADRVTCTQHIVGRGACGALVPLPQDGGLPVRCPYNHVLPWHGTLVPSAGPV